MPQTEAWQPEIVKRDHPFGERGVISSLEEVAERVKIGAVSPKVRMWAIECLDRARKEDKLEVNTDRARAEVILKACQQKLWVPDPVGTEWMAGAHLMACDPSKDGVCFRGNDCLPEGTLVLAEGHELTPIEKLKPGRRIWGLDRWSMVEAVRYKGHLSVGVITLNNGSTVKITSDHKVYVLDCQQHPMLGDQDSPRAIVPGDGRRRSDWRGIGCDCGAEHRVEKRIRVSELRKGMVLTTPNRIPFGTESMDPDRAYVEGLGRDAPEKHLLSINLDEGAAGPYLRGVMADASQPRKSGSRTLTTTSHRLAVQARLLHKMFGVSCSVSLLQPATSSSYIENHGGLGRNPIYRLGTRATTRIDGRHPRLLRVRSIDRDLINVPCWDIQTDDHRVYLAQHDVTVSNCDDLSILLCACLSCVGIYTLVVGHGYTNDRVIQHVLGAARCGGQWLYADPSDPKLKLGECFQFTRERIYSVPNIRMLCDGDACLSDRRNYDPQKERFVDKGEFVGVDGPPAVEFAWLVDRRVEWLGGDFGEDAGGKTAAGACVAEGAAAAAPICEKLGGKVGGLIEDQIEGLFSKPNKEKTKQAELSAAVRTQADMQQETNRVLNHILVTLAADTNEPIANVVAELNERGVAIFDDPNLATDNIWPTVTGGDWLNKNVAATYPYYAPAFWRLRLSNEHGHLSPTRWRRLEDVMRGWIDQLDYGVVGISRDVGTTRSPHTGPLQPATKKKSITPVILIGAAAIGAGLILWGTIG